MLKMFKSTPPKITEQMILDTKIKLMPFENLVIEKSNTLSITGSGKFYKGKYKNWPVSVKIVDICEDPLILNEFVYWQTYNGNNFILSLFGVCLKNKNAYILLEPFNMTLQTALKTNSLTNSSKLECAKQILYILSHFQKEKKKILDLRPEIFGITEEGKVKLLDFGILVNPEKMFNEALITNDRLKYSPPEFFLANVEDLKYDIWSFGCILVDIFSKRQNNNNNNSNTDINVIVDLIKRGKYPVIDTTLNPMLRNIMQKCLEVNCEKRINISALENEFNIFIKCLSTKEVNLNDINDDNNEDIAYYKNFISINEEEIIKENNLISTELLVKNKTFLNEINDIDLATEKILNNNMTYIKKYLYYDFELTKNILTALKVKLQNKVIDLNQTLLKAVGDIMETREILNEMKHYILFLFEIKYTSIPQNENGEDANKTEKTNNPVIISLSSQVDKIRILLSKYSKDNYFDKIETIFNEIESLVNTYKTVFTHDYTLMRDIVDNITQHKERLLANTNIQSFISDLDINIKSFNDHSLSKGQRMKYKDYYIKPKLNSNELLVINTHTKEYTKHIVDSVFFYKKSYAFYDIAQRKVFQSGGIINNVSVNEIFEIDYNINSNTFQIKQLPMMLHPHSLHCMIKIYNNYLCVIGGENTKNCEVYDFSLERWKSLPELPDLFISPCACLYLKYIYIFGNSNQICRLKLLKSLFPYSQNETNALNNNPNNLKWETKWESLKIVNNVNNNNTPLLKYGMCCYLDSMKEVVYLFGGYNDNLECHSDVFKITLGKKKEQNERDKMFEFESITLEDCVTPPELIAKKNIETINNLVIDKIEYGQLITNTFFNSNVIEFDKCYIVNVDTNSTLIEYDISTNDSYMTEYVNEDNTIIQN